jgi:hypothetical protein
LAIQGGVPVRTTLLPYGRQSIDEADIQAVVDVLRSDWLTTGPKVAEFEEAFAAAVGAKFAVSFSSGTAALHGAAFAAGLGPGDEAVTTPMTFCATANCVLYQGAQPVFADVSSDTLNLDPAQVSARISSRSKAIFTESLGPLLRIAPRSVSRFATFWSATLRITAMPEAADTVIAAARAFLGERITTNATLREHHSHGQDTQPPVLPDAVAFIETSDEAARLLALCHAEHVPVVAWGAGTSLEGHVTPVRGGITLDLSRMTRIIDVSQPDMDCRIEAGVTRDQLNGHLRDQGLFFPVDPGTSLCTIGGMCATRASGTHQWSVVVAVAAFGVFYALNREPAEINDAENRCVLFQRATKWFAVSCTQETARNNDAIKSTGSQ